MIDPGERLSQRRYYTIAAAARALDVSETTLRKWIAAKLVIVTLIGPPGNAFKRIAVEELERLKRTA